MKNLLIVRPAVAGLLGSIEIKKFPMDVLRIRNGRRPRAEIQARQRRWIARRSSIDGVWRYDGRISAGEAS